MCRQVLLLAAEYLKKHRRINYICVLILLSLSLSLSLSFSLVYMCRQVLLLAAEYQKNHLPECALHHIEALVYVYSSKKAVVNGRLYRQSWGRCGLQLLVHAALSYYAHTRMPHTQVATLSSVWLKKKLKNYIFLDMQVATLNSV